MDWKRKNTKTVTVGNVLIGGGNPISIQSMTNTSTADVKATLAQIQKLAQAGCQIIRLAVPDFEGAAALRSIVTSSPIPVVADIHFDYKLALASIEAGVHGLRLNPGNIGGRQKVKEVALAAKERNIPIRVGVNAGSLEKDLLEKHGGICPQAMVESALGHIHMLEEEGFDQIVVSLKSSDVICMIDAYEQMSAFSDYPLHIGLTEAGTVRRGSIKSALAVGILLSRGIGDTIRISLTGDPVEEVLVAKEILQALHLCKRGFNFISCPTCGRTQVDVEKIALQVEDALSGIEPPFPVSIAVMGCAVNGPGEAKSADIGIAGGKGEGLLFCKGQVVGRYANADLAKALLDHVQILLSTEQITKT